MLPLFDLPHGDTPALLTVTTVIELAKLAVVAYWAMSSDLRTSAVVLENIAIFGSDYCLRTKLPLSSHYLRRTHLVENDAG